MEPERKENMARATARRKVAKRRRAIRRRRMILWTLCLVLSAVLVYLTVSIVKLAKQDSQSIVRAVKVEAGMQIAPEMFLVDAAGQQVTFVTDISTIDTTKIGTYSIKLSVDGQIYATTLTIEDIRPPVADPVPTVIRNGILPPAQDLVTNIRDTSPVVVTYNKKPDLTKQNAEALIQLTDAAGNYSVVKVPVTVVLDTEPSVPAVTDETPPEIIGATDRAFYLGDPINYKAADAGKGYQDVFARDDSGEAELKIDRSHVNTATPGTYPVTYTATDAAGNTTSVTVQFTISEKPGNYVDPEIVYGLAREILDEITTEDMTEMEVAFKIYYWTITSIDYVGTSDKSHWTGGAYQAFTQRSGDCFNYFAAAKALYDVAGIQNVDVVKSDTSHSSHYWSLINLGDGWYHVDCTPRSVWGAFFMNTDAELEKYSVANHNSHIFDPTAYPERATESVQHLLNYDNGTIKKAGE